MLTTLRRRAELVAELGVDAFLVLPFTTALSQVSAEEFVHDVLVDRLHAAHVVVGENFRFGHRGAGSVDLLRELGPRFGFAVHGVEPGARTGRGDGQLHLRPGLRRGRRRAWPRPRRWAGRTGWRASWCTATAAAAAQLGYPTANLDVAAHAAIPADGIYAGWFVLGTRRSPAAISIGTNPTFSGRERTVEAFVIDEGGNFYGRRVAFDFVERLRDTEKFDSVEALIAQIDADVAQTRTVLAPVLSGRANSRARTTAPGWPGCARPSRVSRRAGDV